MSSLDEKVIYKAKDYNNFIFIKDNRSLKTKGRAYQKLKQSIQAHGQINPVIVDEGFVVVDGQHRVQICRELGIDVEYRYKKGSLAALISLNNDRRNWQLSDYTIHFRGIPSYKKLLDFVSQTGLSLNAVHTCLKGKEVDPEIFKTGKFTIDPEEEKMFKKNVGIILDLINIDGGKHKDSIGKTRAISALALLVSHPKYDNNHFSKRLMNKNRIVSVNTKKDASNTLEELYNKNLPQNKRIYLSTGGK